MDTIWVLVANQAEAGIYSTPRLRGPLTLEDTLTNEIARAHRRDVETDAPRARYMIVSAPRVTAWSPTSA